jgi:hypothetical protein
MPPVPTFNFNIYVYIAIYKVHEKIIFVFFVLEI